MSRRLLLILTVILLGATASASGLSSLTLNECFQRALVRSESIGIRNEDIRIAEAHYLQALGTVLPHLNVKVTEQIQDTSGNAAAGALGTTFIRRSSPEVAIQLNQQLFQGFREFHALRVSNAEKRQNNLQTERARQLLFSDVARAYYTVLEVERSLAIQETIRSTLLKRIAEMRERIQVGKSRRSELLSTESQVAGVEADIEKSRGLVQTSRDFLGFLVGDTITERLTDTFKVPGILRSLDSYLDPLPRRPDLGASKESVRLAKGNLNYEKGGRYPTLNLDANYYPYRVGLFQDTKWDMMFTFNLPLFQGGGTRGRVREATALLKQSELTDQQTNRRTETEVRQAYHGLKSSYARDMALRRAESKAGATYKTQVEEYRLGLVNNLEVLQTLRDWHLRQLEANQSHFETKLQYLQLLVASGDLPL